MIIKVIIFTCIILFFNVSNLFAQWLPLSTNTTDALNELYFVNADTGYVVSSEGSLYKTEDGGNNWEHVFTANYPLTDICMINRDTGFIVGNSGLLMKTVNGWNTWLYMNSGVDKNLRDICFINESDGFYCGQSQIIGRTKNGGKNWFHEQHGMYYLRELAFVNEKGFCVGDLGILMKSTDGGYTWTTENSGSWENLVDIYFVGADTAYICGNNGTILKSINGGQDWHIQTSGTSNNLNGLYFHTEWSGYAVGQDALLMYTQDGGAQWETFPLSLTCDLRDLFFVDGIHGYICCTEGMLLKSCQLPVADFNYSIQDNTVYLENNSWGQDSCLWSFGDGYFSGLHNPEYTYTDTGLYQICLTVGNICGIDSVCREIEITNTHVSYSEIIQLKVYPNPAFDEVFISNPGHCRINYIMFYNVHGRIEKCLKINSMEALISLSINLPQGLYLLRIEMKKGDYCQPVIIQ